MFYCVIITKFLFVCFLFAENIKASIKLYIRSTSYSLRKVQCVLECVLGIAVYHAGLTSMYKGGLKSS